MHEFLNEKNDTKSFFESFSPIIGTKIFIGKSSHFRNFKHVLKKTVEIQLSTIQCQMHT